MSGDGAEPRKPPTSASADQVTPSSTVDGGKTPRPVDSGPNRTPEAPESDLVRSVLDSARQLARGRGGRSASQRRRARADNHDGRGPGGYSGPGPDESDPQPLGAIVAGYVAERGWDRPLAEARVFADWPMLVGSDVAAHCSPTTLSAGELKVSAESTAWATQLRLLSSTLLARLAAELGPDVVSKITVSGPTGPSWKHGGFSVRGARGPRDTYG